MGRGTNQAHVRELVDSHRFHRRWENKQMGWELQKNLVSASPWAKSLRQQLEDGSVQNWT